MKYLLLLILLLPSFAFAESYQKAYAEFQKGRFEEAADILEELVDEGNHKNSVYNLWGLALEIRKDYDGAIKVYSTAAKRNYGSVHNRVLKSYRSMAKLKKISIPRPLLDYYYKLSKLYALQFVETNKKKPRKVTKKYQRYHRLYKRICKAKSYEVDELDEQVTSYNDLITKEKKYRSQSNFLFTLGKSYWQDRLYLKMDSGTRAKLIANIKTLDLAMSYEKVKENYIQSYRLGYMKGTSNVTSEDANKVTYQQEKVPVTVFTFTPTLYYRVNSKENTSLGLGLPIAMRSGSFTEPSGGAISNKSETQVWYEISLRLQKSRFLIEGKFANHSNFSGSLFSGHLGYQF